MMSDYIKREDAIKTLEGWKISGEMILATVPSADVVERSSYESMEHTVAKLNEALSNSVEVIRCKDCRFYEIYPNGANGDCINRIDAFNTFYPNDLCSYGERKDEEL